MEVLLLAGDINKYDVESTLPVEKKSIKDAHIMIIIVGHLLNLVKSI